MRDRSQARCVLVQPQVATVLMIVADVSSHEPDEMTCTENHDVLKELATAAADPFGQEIRPSLRSRGTTRIRVDTAVLHELLRLNKATCDRRPIQE